MILMKWGDHLENHLETLNKEKNKFILKFITIAAAAWIMLSLSCFVAFADEQTTVLTTLQNLEIAGKTDLFMGVFRSLGFVILKFLGSIADTCYSGLESIYNALDFTHSSELLALNKRYSYMYKIVFVISLAILGLYLIGRQSNNQLNTMSCLMIMVVIILAMPVFTEKLSDLTKASASYAQAQWSESAARMHLESISGTIVDDYIIDLKKVDRSINESNINYLKTAVNKYEGYNNLDGRTDEWRSIDITAVMDYDDGDLKKGYWDKHMEKDDEGKWTEEKLSTWIPFMDNYYYRWQFSSWAYPIIMLLILSIVLVFTGFRCGIFIINIAMAEIYLPFISATDIASGQRTKEAIKHFFILFGSIFLCIALLGLYFIGYKWINEHITAMLPKMILQVALAYQVINGPNLIERILGVDVGVGGAWKVALGAKMAADATGVSKAASGIGKAATAPIRVPAGAAKNWTANKYNEGLKNMASKGAESVKGGVDNFKDGFKSSGTDPMNAKTESTAEGAGAGLNGKAGAADNKNTDNTSQKDRTKTPNAEDSAATNGSRVDPMAARTGSTSGTASGASGGKTDNVRIDPDSMSQRSPSSSSPWGSGSTPQSNQPQREQAMQYNPQTETSNETPRSRVNVKDTMNRRKE